MTEEKRVRLGEAAELPPSAEQICSPYDPDALRHQARGGLDRLQGPPHRNLRHARIASRRACRHDTGQREQGRAHRADPRGAGGQGLGPVRASGGPRLCQRGPPHPRAGAARHQPGRPGAAPDRLASQCQGRVRQGGFHRRSGTPGGPPPRRPQRHELAPIPRQRNRTLHPRTLLRSRRQSLPVQAALHARTRSGPPIAAALTRAARSAHGRPGAREHRSRPALVRNAGASKARPRQECAASGCGRHAVAAWPRQACNKTGLQSVATVRPSTLTAWRHGSPDAPSHPHGYRALLQWPPDGRIRQRHPNPDGHGCSTTWPPRWIRPRMGGLSFSSVPRPGAPASLRQHPSRPVWPPPPAGPCARPPRRPRRSRWMPSHPAPPRP